jgi:hypothetical protein
MLRAAASLCVVGFFLVVSRAQGQSPRVLYTWKGTGNVQGWTQGFGDNQVLLQNEIDGELTATENGTEGLNFALGDDANIIAEGGPTIGGLDLTGLSALEFDLGHNGAGPVDVQFFVQATPGFTYLGLGPDQPVVPGVATYSAPLGDLAPDQIAYIRAIGVNIRDHTAEGNLIWTLREVRSAGTPLKFRDYATHDPGTSDNGLQGAIVNFDNAAVDGNDGGQNQSGLQQHIELPAGDKGFLEWIDLATGPGAAITWHNGTVFNGNTFNERPTDMSNYTSVFLRMAATPVAGGAVESVGVQYFLQTGNFDFQQAGSIQSLPADGELHVLEFPISALRRLDFVPAHGINLQSHAGGDLIIDVDNLRAVKAASFPDCNSNGVPDEGDLANGTSSDCNVDGLPDECDIKQKRSLDCNSNGIPDECDIAGEPVTRVLYTWAGLDDVRDWMKIFGQNDALLENKVDGELTVTETGEAGTGVAISDGFNRISEESASLGGLDLTGAGTLEIDVGHDGPVPVQAQFFVQATPAFQYLALGPDVAIQPGVSTYSLPLNILNPAQATYIRTIGINIRDHLDSGNLTWTVREVRVIGVPLTQRDYATHEPGSSDNGLQGAVVGFDNLAVEGNDGTQNQTGLRQNVGNSPPGNTGSLEWTDLAGQGGGAVSWFNGTAWIDNTFNERTTDMSGYDKIIVRLAATNRGGAVASVDVQYLLQTGNFQPHEAGPAQPFPVDGQFHDLIFPLAGIPDLAYVDAHGINLGEHADGDLVIDVDNIRAVSERKTKNDCNASHVPDDCDIASGALHDADGNHVPDECEEVRFRRGDANSDGIVNIADAVTIFTFLFLGGVTPLCMDAADSDDTGQVVITDGIFILNFLFLGGRAIPDPGTQRCGPDVAQDGLEKCAYPAGRCP